MPNLSLFSVRNPQAKAVLIVAGDMLYPIGINTPRLNFADRAKPSLQRPIYQVSCFLGAIPVPSLFGGPAHYFLLKIGDLRRLAAFVVTQNPFSLWRSRINKKSAHWVILRHSYIIPQFCGFEP